MPLRDEKAGQSMGRIHFDLRIDPTRWRADLLRIILGVIFTLGMLVCVPSVALALHQGLIGVAAVDVAALSIVLALLWFDQLPVGFRATVLCLTLYGLGVCLMVYIGSISQIYLFGFSIIATLLLGLKTGLAATLLSSLTLFTLGLIGFAAPEMLQQRLTYDLNGWFVITLNFALVNTLLTLAIGAMFAALDRALFLEITARTSLDRERKILRTLIDALPDVIFTRDTQGRFVHGNQATLALVGLEREDQLSGKTVFDVFSPHHAEKFHAEDETVLAGRPLLNKEEFFAVGRGGPRWYLTIKVPLRSGTGEIIGLIGIARDITDRKKLEEQLRQSHKMEAIGKLAGGVAHDFNNLLTVISGYCEILLNLPAESFSHHGAVRTIRDAAERAASLTRQLLAFGRQSLLQPRVLDLNEVVAGTAAMLDRLIGENIRLETRLAPGLWSVRVDPGQLDQVLINLAVNARDAMPRGGTLTIETRNVQLHADDLRDQPGLAPGGYVLLAVSDSGEGMPPEVLGRIFEPFFTTKGVGEGTGLGLATVFGIVQQSGGCIHAASEVGRGSTFKLYFPASEVSSPESAAPGSTPPANEGAETVLIVEDEPGVRKMAQLSLELQGYKVLTAANGVEALKIANARGEDIDLLITDVVMPLMSGPDLAKNLSSRFARLQILFMSGYPGDATTRHGLLDLEAAFIQKPYSPSTLAEKVRQVLDGRHTTARCATAPPES
jgi:PAS domain S-box-containing protein